MLRLRRRTKGFTLTELLIVIALIAILAIGALIVYRMQLAKAYDAIRKRDLNALKIAFEHYYADHACYPTTGILNNCGGPELQPYLDAIPCDPETHLPYTLNLDLPFGCSQKFFVYTDLANTSDPQIRCNGRYVAASENVTEGELDITCRGETFCNTGYYGCTNGVCQLISAIEKPACGPLFCSSSCQGSCGDPSWALQPPDCTP